MFKNVGKLIMKINHQTPIILILSILYYNITTEIHVQSHRHFKQNICALLSFITKLFKNEQKCNLLLKRKNTEIELIYLDPKNTSGMYNNLRFSHNWTFWPKTEISFWF